MSVQTKYYAIKDVHTLIFDGAISLTTLHKLVRNGDIPSSQFLKRRLIPSWWVEEQIAKLKGVQNEVH
ncbi:MAG: hypothetical protein J6M62_11380 [Selenomonadaceae bacterium]|nr:hypothetical protein [Selenomonadaceae bacterium]